MTAPTTPPIDMSPEAIGRRLAELEDLYQFWRSIRTARRVSPEEVEPSQTGGDSSLPHAESEIH